MLYPDDLKYTDQHEWVRTPGSTPDSVRIGITDYAQDALGDIVYVTLPAVGAELTRGESCGELESTKSVSDLYAPLTGVVVACNDKLDTEPELVNSDPYDAGWMIDIRPTAPDELADLLSADAYQSSLDTD